MANSRNRSSKRPNQREETETPQTYGIPTPHRPPNRLFEEHKELIELFGKLKELRTREEQASSLELAEHANKVMATLDEGIKELDDMDTFFSFLTEIGQSHKKIPGFKPEFFWKIETPFLEAVQMTLGDRYTENIENIYKITIKLIIETLVKGYDDT